MPPALRRLVAAAILALAVVGAGAGIARAVVAIDHSCCGGSAGDLAPATPCEGFLPLTCCDAAALPGHDGGMGAALDAPVPLAAAVTPTPPLPHLTPPPDAPLPVAAPRHLSVVLQL